MLPEVIKLITWSNAPKISNSKQVRGDYRDY